MDMLKKSLAPITDEAWKMINDQARRILSSRLTARKFVDVDGPKGWDFSAVNRGRLDIPKNSKVDDVEFGVRRVLPLVEFRSPFSLNIWELDNAVRGAADVDLSEMEDAANQATAFEEKAIYYGFEKGEIPGLIGSSSLDKMSCPTDAEGVLQCIPEAISKLKEASIEGPYHLVVNPTEWREITSYARGYPMKRQIKDNLDAELIFCPNIDNMFLVTSRGGDYKLTLGVDISIGYDHHDKDNVRLYFTESFTFQVLEPSAVVVFE